MSNITILTNILSFSIFIMGLIIGIKIIKKKKKTNLNFFFACFFIFFSLGFLTNTIYHIHQDNRTLIWIFYYLTTISFNIALTSLLLSTLIYKYLENNKKKQYFLFIIFLFISLVGYLFFYPTLNEEAFDNHDIDTNINIYWNYFVNSYRFLILMYACLTFFKELKHSQGIVRVKLNFFSIGLWLGIIGLSFVLISFIDCCIESAFKLCALIFFILGSIQLYRGLGIHPD